MFFDNSGGSLRLKKCVESKAELECLPDCPERTHQKAKDLKKVVVAGTEDILKIIFGAKSGALVTELTASQTMFQMIKIIMETEGGDNVVVSSLEHPSAFDAVEFYAKKTGRELRVIPADKVTGGINVEDVVKLVDKNTKLVSVMGASNVTGRIINVKEIAKRVREINPDIYVVCDMVQHAPHSKIDVEDLGVDCANFAPYKFFGVRGCGFGYVSDRVAKLPHHKLIAKDEKVFELGTPSPGNFSATLEIINYVCEIGEEFIGKTSREDAYNEGMRRIHLQERALLNRLLEGSEEVEGLRHIDKVKVHVDDKDLTKRDLIVAMGIEGIDYSDLVKEYEKRNIIVCDRVRSSMYAKRIIEAIGIGGAIRVSPLHCHSAKDIDKFLKVTKEIASSL